MSFVHDIPALRLWHLFPCDTYPARSIVLASVLDLFFLHSFVACTICRIGHGIGLAVNPHSNRVVVYLSFVFSIACQIAGERSRTTRTVILLLILLLSCVEWIVGYYFAFPVHPGVTLPLR